MDQGFERFSLQINHCLKQIDKLLLILWFGQINLIDSDSLEEFTSESPEICSDDSELIGKLFQTQTEYNKI